MKENVDTTKILGIAGIGSILGIFIGSRSGGTYILEIGNNLLLISMFATFLLFLLNIYKIKGN